MDKQQRASELTLRDLKENFPSLPYEVKYSVSLKKALQGDGDWAHIKEILGWLINMQDGNLRLPPKRLAEFRILLAIPPSQRRMSTKKLERLIGKLRSMHLAIPGAVGHFYHFQIALTAANHVRRATAYLSKDFHRDVQFWKSLCADMGYRPTLFTEKFQRLTTEVGYADASGLRCGGDWIEPNEDGVH